MVLAEIEICVMCWIGPKSACVEWAPASTQANLLALRIAKQLVS